MDGEYSLLSCLFSFFLFDRKYNVSLVHSSFFVGQGIHPLSISTLLTLWNKEYSLPLCSFSLGQTLKLPFPPAKQKSYTGTGQLSKIQNTFDWIPLPVLTLILIKSNSLLPAQIRIFNGVPPPSHLRTLTKNMAFLSVP
jgi:hypothetical protein